MKTLSPLRPTMIKFIRYNCGLTNCFLFLPDGVKLIMDLTTDCGIIHGSIYSCLRAIFGLSIAGVLIAIFICLLIWQLLLHQRKKKQWEQLDQHCRNMYANHQSSQSRFCYQRPPSGRQDLYTVPDYCRCCEAHRQTLQTVLYPWNSSSLTTSPTCDSRDSTGIVNDDDNYESESRRGWSWLSMPWKRNFHQHSNSQHSHDPQNRHSSVDFYSHYNNSNYILHQHDYLSTNRMELCRTPPPPYFEDDSPPKLFHHESIELQLPGVVVDECGGAVVTEVESESQSNDKESPSSSTT